tara:strand:+ start:149 stop:310 length:162 start_codon:yes stop_codon:yes gene_type:complete
MWGLIASYASRNDSQYEPYILFMLIVIAISAAGIWQILWRWDKEKENSKALDD